MAITLSDNVPTVAKELWGTETREIFNPQKCRVVFPGAVDELAFHDGPKPGKSWKIRVSISIQESDS
jgi:hypothetical protein